ncbi:DNA double-strand break repair nuclease NurA [Rubrivirga sp.]|uniref:DNA double-strand break repair nuclease NurA n=1 Tax=Rubrivirga sp. TaxID=1885344 RepID=UPI003B51B64C
MLDFARLAAQIADFAAYRVDEDRSHGRRLDRGHRALDDCAPGWEALRDRALAQSGGPLRAIPRTRPDECHGCEPRPATVTVVATDGSQIFPDRHVEPACYLLNVGRVAFHYGTLDPPLIQAEPTLRYHQQDLADLAEDDSDASPLDATSEVVSALRDELELRWLFDTADQERRSGRAVVAMADGTLIRWMLRGMKNRRLETLLLARYVAELDRFREAGIPVCSYVSRPANAEVVNLLRLHRDEPDWEPGPDSLRGLQDRHLYQRRLAVGERSAVFLSRSEVLKAYGDHRIVAFYVHGCGEVGRVEMPEWVAEVPGWLGLIHAVVLDQCEKGGGYPIILQEAHERAVVRAREKEVFYRILARQARGAGASAPTYSGKAASKQAPRV